MFRIRWAATTMDIPVPRAHQRKLLREMYRDMRKLNYSTAMSRGVTISLLMVFMWDDGRIK